jgi:hypothetical protein
MRSARSIFVSSFTTNVGLSVISVIRNLPSNFSSVPSAPLIFL